MCSNPVLCSTVPCKSWPSQALAPPTQPPGSDLSCKSPWARQEVWAEYSSSWRLFNACRKIYYMRGERKKKPHPEQWQQKTPKCIHDQKILNLETFCSLLKLATLSLLLSLAWQGTGLGCPVWPNSICCAVMETQRASTALELNSKKWSTWQRASAGWQMMLQCFTPLRSHSHTLVAFNQLIEMA